MMFRIIGHSVLGDQDVWIIVMIFYPVQEFSYSPRNLLKPCTTRSKENQQYLEHRPEHRPKYKSLYTVMSPLSISKASSQRLHVQLLNCAFILNIYIVPLQKTTQRLCHKAF